MGCCVPLAIGVTVLAVLSGLLGCDMPADSVSGPAPTPADTQPAAPSPRAARKEAIEAVRQEAWHQELSEQVSALEKKKEEKGGTLAERVAASGEWNKARLELERREASAVERSPAVLAAEKNRAEADAQRRDENRTYSADQVVAFYDANEVAGDDALKGRVFKIEGVVERVGKDLLGTSYVALKADRAGGLRAVQCFFSKDKNDQLAALQPGQHVVIRGKCSGLMMNVLMKECELVK